MRTYCPAVKIPLVYEKFLDILRNRSLIKINYATVTTSFKYGEFSQYTSSACTRGDYSGAGASFCIVKKQGSILKPPLFSSGGFF